MDGHRGRVRDAEQPGRQPPIVEIQLRRLHQPLAEVGVVRRQPECDVARLQHAEPITRRGLGNAQFVRDGIQVQQLAGAGGHHAHEALELQQVGDAAELAHIALDITCDVAGMPI